MRFQFTINCLEFLKMFARLRSLFTSRFFSSRIAKQDRAVKRRRLTRHLMTEHLEQRQLFATLVNPSTVTWQDTDGDNVTLVFSKPVLTNNANAILKFDTGSVNGSNAIQQQLKSINLNRLEAGTDIHVDAIASLLHGGDGYANIGEIVSIDAVLGNVVINGELGRIASGIQNPNTLGLAGLHVRSLGAKGLTTGASNRNSIVNGEMGALNVDMDMDTSLAASML